MIPVTNNIIIEVDPNQKDECVLGGNIIKTGKQYSENFREKNPVIGIVKQGYGEIKEGMWVVSNYSHFDEGSLYLVYDNLYSVPIDEQIFAIINENGTLTPICGNLLVRRINKTASFELPDDFIKPFNNKGYVVKGIGNYKKDDFIFWLPYSDYVICYYWNGVYKEEIKIHESEIVGILK